MQQLDSVLLARGNQSKVSQSGPGGNSQAPQKFALHLDKLTDQIDQRKQQGGLTEAQAVSDLAKTMLQNADDDELSADEAWLSMVEELNSMAAGDVSLEELSSRHDIDLAALEEQLEQALAEFDGDMRALVAELQQVSGGKGLPTATDELKNALANIDSSDSGITDLLTRIDELSPQQQAQFVARLDELMTQLTELQADDSGLVTDKTKIELAEISHALQEQIRSLLDSATELSEQQKGQLESHLVLLEKINELSTESVFSQPQSAEQVTEALAEQELPGIAHEQSELSAARQELADLLSALQALFNSSEASEGQQSQDNADAQAWLQTVDMKALQGELNELLNTLDGELDGMSRGQLLALLQSQLQALEGIKQSDADAQASGEGDESLARMSELLSALNHKLDAAQADIRVIDASRHSEQGNTLSPVAHALNQASQQLRAQLQNALQADQAQSDESDDTGDFDNLRRLLSESVASTSEPRQSASAANQPGVGLQNMQQGNLGQAALAQNNSAQRTPEQPAQSAFEAARQAQQAIDILGTGASERLRERVSVMFNSRTQAAEMRLDPPDLGRLNIRLNMNQEQATVSFQVTTPQAREALEQQLPRLRELLAEQGIELADANVSEEQQDGSREASSGQGEYASGDESALGDNELMADGALEVASPVASADGRVDYFV